MSAMGSIEMEVMEVVEPSSDEEMLHMGWNQGEASLGLGRHSYSSGHISDPESASDSLLGSPMVSNVERESAVRRNETMAGGSAAERTSRLRRLRRALTKYSIEGDSTWSNLKRNVWCNVSNGGRVVYRKLSEPAVRKDPNEPVDTTNKRLPYDIVDVYKTIEDPHIFTSEMNKKFRKKNVVIRLVSFLLMEQSWLLLLLLGSLCAMTAILLNWCVSTFSACK